MLPLQIAENIYDVGVQDWAVRDFTATKQREVQPITLT